MEQYATITESPSRTILLHVVPVKVIAPSGSSLTTYALLQQEHCEQSGFKRTATACVREHCCRENERTFPVGALRAPRSREGEQVNKLSAPHNWSMEDMRAVETLQRTTRLSDGRYETGLLWKNPMILPKDHHVATILFSICTR